MRRSLLSLVPIAGLLACSSAAPSDEAIAATPATPTVDAAAPAAPSAAPASAPAARGPVSVPITFVNGGPTVKISIDDGPPVDALLDSGSVGLWVMRHVVPAGTKVSTTPVHQQYAGKVSVDGVVATGVVNVGGVATKLPVSFAEVVQTECLPDQTCGHVGDGTLLGFEAVLGVALRHPRDVVVNPLPAVTESGQYVVRLDPGTAPSGTLVLDPDASTLARFQNRVPLTADGAGGWKDNVVPFCVNAFCSTGMLDSGRPLGLLLLATQPGDYRNIGVPRGTEDVPDGTALDVTIHGVDAFHFVADENGERAGIKTSGFGNNLAAIAFRHLDVLYDTHAGDIGVAPKTP